MMDRLRRREVGVTVVDVKQHAFKDPVNTLPAPHSHMLMTAAI